MPGFNPYHKWLGIPKDVGRPTDGQILGVSDQEDDPDVIAAAAVRQSAYVRNFQTGKHAADATRILGEIEEAKIVLLRATQDRSPTPATIAPAMTAPARQIPVRPKHAITRLPVRRSKPPRRLGLVVAACSITVTLGIFVFYLGPEFFTPAKVSRDTGNAKDLEHVDRASDRRTPSPQEVELGSDQLNVPTKAAPVIEKSPGGAVSTGNEPGSAAIASNDHVGELNAKSAAKASANQPSERGIINGNALPTKGVAQSASPSDDGATQSRPTPSPKSEPDKTITNSIGMKLVLIPAGEFLMGSSESPEELVHMYAKWQAGLDVFVGEQPQHRVCISEPFYLGIYEVTLGQFRQFVEAASYVTEPERDGKGGWGWNMSKSKEEQDEKYNWRRTGITQSDDHPVINVTWNDAQAFCAWLSAREGRQYSLPTEARWEYACRAGTTTQFNCGNDPEELPRVGNVNDGFLTTKDGYGFFAPVGRFQANAFGLYDMHGNVWEWCLDSFAEDYYETSPVNDPPGPPIVSVRVCRGGCFGFYLWNNRSADRDWSVPSRREDWLGFRVALVVSPGNDSHSASESVESQEATEGAKAVSQTKTLPRTILQESLLNCIGMKLALIPAGEFMMGSNESPESQLRALGMPNMRQDDLRDEHPRHKVTISQPFYLSTCEVTQVQYAAVMGTRPWVGKEYVQEGDSFPASHVSWQDAAEFCDRLGRKENLTYRLPTEAEWEYACRAGSNA